MKSQHPIKDIRSIFYFEILLNARFAYGKDLVCLDRAGVGSSEVDFGFFFFFGWIGCIW